MGFYVALVFLTRIPLPQIELDQDKISSSVRFFPLAGVVIGAVVWGVSVAGSFFLPPPVLAAVMVLADVVITGGMHLDALADTMDGLFCYGDREKKLTVMRDSRTGAYGVVGLILFILFKYILFSSLLDYNNLYAILIYPVLGRWLITYTMEYLPYARKEGLGKDFVESKPAHSFMVSSAITLTFTWGVSGVEGLAVAFVAMAVGVLLSIFFKRQFGGMTGDIYGAINSLVEVSSLLAFVIISYLGGT